MGAVLITPAVPLRICNHFPAFILITSLYHDKSYLTSSNIINYANQQPFFSCRMTIVRTTIVVRDAMR